MHVYDVWKTGHAGAGIHSTILDDGVEPTHLDLVGNYVRLYSLNSKVYKVVKTIGIGRVIIITH